MEEQKVEYVIKDDAGAETTYQPSTNALNLVEGSTLNKEALAAKLALLMKLEKRIARKKLNARNLAKRVTKRRKADKAAKASRKKNR